MKTIITKKQYKEIINLFESPQEFIDSLKATKDSIESDSNNPKFICTTLQNKLQSNYGIIKAVKTLDLISPIISDRDRIPKKCKTKNYCTSGIAVWLSTAKEERILYLETLIKKCESYQVN